jgi:hypothetical protein
MEESILAGIDWITAGVTTVSTTGIFAFFGLGMKKYFEAKLSSNFRKSEAQFQAEIRARDEQISSIRDGALSSLNSREMALYQEKVLAVRQLWSCVVSLGKAKNLSSFMAGIDYESFVKAAADEPKYRAAVRMIDNVDISNFDMETAYQARPFVTPLLWAYFTAYKAILLNAVVRADFIKSGLGEDLTNIKYIKGIVKAVLPHQSGFIDSQDVGSFYHLIEELEDCILAEMRQILDGENSSIKSIEKAKKITKAVQSMEQQSSSAG